MQRKTFPMIWNQIQQTPSQKRIPIPMNRNEFKNLSYVDAVRLKRFFPEEYEQALRESNSDTDNQI